MLTSTVAVLQIRNMLFMETPAADRHTTWEDIQGIVTGVILVALSIQFLRSADLVTGQIAGLALIATYLSGVSFGLIFFVLNLPFYIIAVKQMGWRFAIKSLGAVALLSVTTEIMPKLITIETMHPAAAAIMCGLTAGCGMISLFRHGTTLGGAGIVGVWLQNTRGIKAGHVLLAVDICVFALAMSVFDWPRVAWSLLGAVILNLVVTVNHRNDRYIANPERRSTIHEKGPRSGPCDQQ